MAHLPLNTLPAFVAAAREPTLRRAAEKLHVTHSAISQQLRLLETQLGTPLFERRGRRLVLNAAGQALLAQAEPALAALARGVQAAQAAASGAAQTLRISVLPSFATRWLLPRIGRWRERHPHLVLELHTSLKLVNLPQDGFHAAVRQGPGPWPGLHAERLMSSPLIAVAAPARAERLAGAAIEALAAEPLIGRQPLWQRWFAERGWLQPLRPVAEFTDAGLALQAAEQDIGITLGRELLAADALQQGRLARLPGPPLADDREQAYWWVCPQELHGWPPLQALRAWVLEEIERSRVVVPSA